ncbi:antitoxin VbhA family protein [Bifidobacterium longum]|uniref:antitoxin VbhA family protein n=1 Tax=Bifidobacterium longum TaxID=216816 RepID=UPI000E46F18F|nr:antitoxin VbhA family protein [Bifidobacterium longum]RGX36378.1 hypothetical protein DWV25_03190 [Bifidobacterium longum]RGX40700.1 hypothetical protein DWV23_03190 [Bifidobacterium longum]RGX48300.1 hypothetical protein DWV21_03185 [Bifidobacterium longum]
MSDDIEFRRELVRGSVVSARLEGGAVSDQWRADSKDYINGVIDSLTFLNRTRARYGLPKVMAL